MKLKRYIVTVFLITSAALCTYYLKAYFSRKTAYRYLAKIISTSVERLSGEVGLYIKDINTGAVVKYNENKLFPPASLIKIPIMVAMYQAIYDGNYSLSDKIVLKQKYKVGGSGKLKNIAQEENLLFKNLLTV